MSGTQKNNKSAAGMLTIGGGQLRLGAKEESHDGAHYAAGEIECIDAIRAALGKEGFRHYVRGIIIAYAWRYGKKDPPPVEAAKIEVYSNWLLANENDDPLRKPQRDGQ